MVFEETTEIDAVVEAMLSIQMRTLKGGAAFLRILRAVDSGPMSDPESFTKPLSL